MALWNSGLTDLVHLSKFSADSEPRLRTAPCNDSGLANVLADAAAFVIEFGQLIHRADMLVSDAAQDLDAVDTGPIAKGSALN